MGDTIPLGWAIALQILTAGAVYGGIRSDIRHLHREVSEAKAAASRAHARMDDFLNMNSTGSHQPYRAHRRSEDKQ